MLPKKLVFYALLGAILVGLQVAMAGLPNIEVVSVLIMAYTVVLGTGVAYVISVFVLLEIFIWGVSTWAISYLYVWAILALLAWQFRNMESAWGWAILCGSFGLAFGALCALVYLPVGGIPMFIATWVAGIPFDILHCIGNFITTLILFRPCRRLLSTLWQEKG